MHAGKEVTKISFIIVVHFLLIFKAIACMPHGILILLMNSVPYFHLLLTIILTPYHFGFYEKALNLVYLFLYH